MNRKELETMVKELRDIISKHLEESGAIRTDLSWLKKAFWTMVVLFGAQVATRLFQH